MPYFGHGIVIRLSAQPTHAAPTHTKLDLSSLFCRDYACGWGVLFYLSVVRFSDL